MQWQETLLDCTDQPDPENIRTILDWLARTPTPGTALDALEALVKIAYPGEQTHYICRICGDTIDVPRRSGKSPTLCKKTECQRTANRERVQRHRRQKEHPE